MGDKKEKKKFVLFEFKKRKNLNQSSFLGNHSLVKLLTTHRHLKCDEGDQLGTAFMLGVKCCISFSHIFC